MQKLANPGVTTQPILYRDTMHMGAEPDDHLAGTSPGGMSCWEDSSKDPSFRRLNGYWWASRLCFGSFTDSLRILRLTSTPASGYGSYCSRWR